MQGRASLARYENQLQQLTLDTEQQIRSIQSPRIQSLAAHQMAEEKEPHGTARSTMYPSGATARSVIDTHDMDLALDGGPPLDASLSSQYLARRFNRSQGLHSGAGGLPSPRPGIGGIHTDRPYNPPAPEYHASNDIDFKLEALQLMLSSFKTKMRQDFDSTFTSIERKSRTQRKEILAHVTASLEEVETRLAASLKSNLGDYQLLEIEFRKNLKIDLYTLRSEMEAAIRNEEELRTDLMRKVKMQESVAQELRQKVEEVLIGGRGISSPAGSMHFDQQLLSFQHSLDALQTKFALEVMTHRKETEMKNVELGHQILDLRKIVETQLTNEEANQRAQVDFIRSHGDANAKEIQARVDESLNNMNGLLKNLYRNLELATQNQDVLHAQLSDMQARESGQGLPPGQRKVAKSELDAVEEKLLAIVHGPTGAAASAGTLRELQNTQELHARKLDQLAGQARETLDESELRGRIALEKFKQEFTLSTEGRLGNITLDQEILKRKIDLLQPEIMQHELTSKVALVEKDLTARLQVAREEQDRVTKQQQQESQLTRDRTQAIERRQDDLTALVQSLVGQVKDLSTQAQKSRDDTQAREKKHLQDLFELREKHTADLHALRREMEESLSQREKDLREELSRTSHKILQSTDEKHGELHAKLAVAESAQVGARVSVERSLADELTSQVRRIDGEMKRFSQQLIDVESQSRRNEEVMRLAEEIAKTSAQKNESTSATQAEIQAIHSQIGPLQLQVKLLQDKQEHVLRTVSDAVVSQSTLQNSVAATQREIERSIASVRQEHLESLKQSQNQLSHMRGDLEATLSNVESRLTKDAYESRLKLQDLEHALKLAKKFRGSGGDENLSPRMTSPATDGSGMTLAEVAAGGSIVKDSVVRSIQVQLEELEFKYHSLSQVGASLKVQQEDLAPRVDLLEREIGDVRKRALQRDTVVDEALRSRIEVLTFEKFKREFAAQTQSQQAATLSTAQTALAIAQQAKYAVAQQGIAQSSSAAWTPAPAPLTGPIATSAPSSFQAPVSSPSPPRSLSPVNVPLRSLGRTNTSELTGQSATEPEQAKSVVVEKKEEKEEEDEHKDRPSTLSVSSSSIAVAPSKHVQAPSVKVTSPLSPVSTNSQPEEDIHEKGESDDDLNLGFSPVSKKSAVSDAPAPKAVGSMMGGGEEEDESSDDESEHSASPQKPTPSTSAASSASSATPASRYAVDAPTGRDEWDTVNAAHASSSTGSSTTVPSFTKGSVDDDDDDVSDDSDDEAINRMKPLASIDPVTKYSLKPGGSSRGGLASSLIGKKPLGGRSTISSLPSTSPGSRGKSNFKIGMNFDEPVEEEDEETPGEGESEPPARPTATPSQLPPHVGRTTLPSLAAHPSGIGELTPRTLSANAFAAPSVTGGASKPIAAAAVVEGEYEDEIEADWEPEAKSTDK